MQSSQALAQSIFGTIAVSGRLPILADIVAENGLPAFGPVAAGTVLELEKQVTTLGEPRLTSIDVWLGGSYRVAVECKLAEADFGTCSRTRLRPRDNNYASDFCDGTYTRQRGRQSNGALTQSNIHYWDYLDELLGWRPDIEHWPCRLSATYQLVRNILAVCVVANGEFRADAGHALTIYDERNPAMAADGRGMQQWDAVHEALKQAPLLRRLSWQSLISQLPGDPVLDWLKEEMTLKYGLSAS